MSLVLLLILIVLIMANVPIFAAMMLATFAFTFFYVGLPLEALIQRMFSGMDKFALLAVPLFIFAANVMRIGGLSTRLINLAQSLVGHLPGGLALTTIVACMLFGAVSGSSPATVVAIGGIILPALKKNSYPEQFSVGIVTSSASVALIIPPSIGMIIYGVVTGASVGDLFIAGIVPGILMGLSFLLYSWFYANHSSLPTAPRASMREILMSFRAALWALGTPVFILGGIYGGIFTPTEAAAIACVYAVAVTGFIYREITLKQLLETAVESAANTAQIMILIAVASSFSWLLTVQQIPQDFSASLLSLSESPVVILLVMNLILLVAGMFIDPTSTTLIFAPIFIPIAMSLGMDPVHLGVIIVVNAAIGMYTPPFGFNLFVASGISKLSIDKMTPGVMPFIAIGILFSLLVTFVPQLSLWLPEALK
ncbi:TRAP transporter large permease [Roseovarius atlanticus]|uniref:TRAP transporter large permease n=1 Tax=Roseovarius atlanticus TaxID=1641875 RepID=UPI001C96C070|nr:TRAP transporter large permease subunit [Roseovarius atlanticus]MBY5990005.1 TRAP transporter large permease subunit [Roseovarius atlanticus]MBY6126550.1 TRAP transporter large permease subunit [Roseovarius atlanticus]MBY6151044.1 TRAP transporter large permease subunit [Roseovarius atlanticus]